MAPSYATNTYYTIHGTLVIGSVEKAVHISYVPDYEGTMEWRELGLESAPHEFSTSAAAFDFAKHTPPEEGTLRDVTVVMMERTVYITTRIIEQSKVKLAE